MQVNSLGLTEQQPENNVYRILMEMLAVTLSKKARARAVQLPAWNEALGLPRPWDQQWSLRMQQVLAYETDLLEYGDLFDGNPAVERKVAALKEGARAELARIDEMGGAVAAIDYMKARWSRANAERVPDRARRAGRDRRQQIHRDRTLAADHRRGRIEVVDPAVEAEQIERLNAWREQPRRLKPRSRPLTPDLRAAAQEGRNIMPASIAAAKAGVTTGEWGRSCARSSASTARRPASASRGRATVRPTGGDLAAVRAECRGGLGQARPAAQVPGRQAGLDGHSNGAEQIAVRARDCGMEVVYEGIRLTPAQIVNAALEEGVHVVGLSILSGSHLPLIKEVMDGMRAARARRRAGGRRRHHPG